MSRAIVLLLTVLPIVACSFGQKKRTLRYPEVYVYSWNGSHFRSVRWDSSQHTGPCPLIVRLPAGDLGSAALSDPVELRRSGWLERVDGNRVLLYRQTPPGLVQCVYEGGRLVEVEVTSAEGGRVELAVGSRWLALPATPDDITGALGSPPRAD